MSTPSQGVVVIKRTANKIANDNGSKVGLGTHIKMDFEFIQDIRIETIHNHYKKRVINETTWEATAPRLIKIVTRNKRSDNNEDFIVKTK